MVLYPCDELSFQPVAETFFSCHNEKQTFFLSNFVTKTLKNKSFTNDRLWRLFSVRSLISNKPVALFHHK